MRYVLTVIAASALLVACGGGSDDNNNDGVNGGGTTVPSTPSTPGTPGNNKSAIDSSNYVAVAQRALATNAYILNTGSTVLGTEVSDPALVFQLGQNQLRRLLHRDNIGVAHAIGAVYTDEERCSGGGKEIYQFDDANNNGIEDAGDSFTTDSQNCVESGVTINGKIKILLESVSGNIDGFPISVSASALYSNLTVSAAGQRVTGNGNMKISFSAQSESSQDVTVRAGSFNATTVSSGITTTQALENYDVSLRIRTAGGQQVYTSSFNGSFIDSAFGGQSITVKTTQPLERSGNQLYANRGELVVFDRAGAQLRVRVTSATTVTIDLDADGNGSYETTTNKLWSEML